jgi:hypothetical protein
MADKDADFSGVTNPKRVVDKRMSQAEGSDAGELGKSWDESFGKGDMPQSDFSGYKDGSPPRKAPPRTPPASMLKKRASKD